MHTPKATYRIQFTPKFGFKEAKEIVPYLAALGVSDLYASPIFKAVPGSLHGYDVTDPNMLNPELGTREDFQSLSATLKINNMGLLQDIVPNHTAFHQKNRMLMDVLEKGEQSEFSDFFDIRICEEEEGKIKKIAVPVLSQPFDEAISSGYIKLVFESRRLRIKYFESWYPLRWESYTEALNSEKISNEELAGYLQTLDTPEEPAAAKEEALEGISKLYEKSAEVKDYIDRRLEYINGLNSLTDRYRTLRDILSRQYFRLISWRESYRTGNYRRFFYLNDFICLNMDRRDVFERTHGLIFDLIEKGHVNGLRIDHIDGLYQPERYLNRLRQKFAGIYIVVEKILSMDERLPAQWPVQGTTGYDFLNYANGLFCDARATDAMTEFYDIFVGSKQDWRQILAESKKLIMNGFMECDLIYLANLAAVAIKKQNGSKSISVENIKHVLSQIIAELSIYRTYIVEDISPQDKQRLDWAIEKASGKLSAYKKELKQISLLLFSSGSGKAEPDLAHNFVMRFQQLTGPVTAKGLEDTAFYRYNRLVSLNEVGGHPERFGISDKAFNDFIGERSWTFRHSMNALSTHDTKRGEDARARINVLSEMPDLWRQSVEHWSSMNESFKRKIGGTYAPAKIDEYLLYQNMIGSFPFEQKEEAEFIKRLKDISIKSAREAKVHTDWDDPVKDYEDALLGFIDDVTMPNREFMNEFKTFQKDTAYFGIFNSLSQTLLKLTVPGVPDFYQGCEMWNLAMVDPDNRRQVYFSEYSRILKSIATENVADTAALLSNMLGSMFDGRIKMYLVWKALHLRAGFRALFETGDYVPLEVRGSLSYNLFAFARILKDQAAVIAVPRFLSKIITPQQLPLGSVWNGTEIVLPTEGLMAWHNCFTEERLDLDQTCRATDLLANFPVACIVNTPHYRLKPQ